MNFICFRIDISRAIGFNKRPWSLRPGWIFCDNSFVLISDNPLAVSPVQRLLPNWFLISFHSGWYAERSVWPDRIQLGKCTLVYRILGDYLLEIGIIGSVDVLWRPVMPRPSDRRSSGQLVGMCVAKKASDLGHSDRLRNLVLKLFPPHTFWLSEDRGLSNSDWPALVQVLVSGLSGKNWNLLQRSVPSWTTVNTKSTSWAFSKKLTDC
jgi:hypothetical protein